MDYTKSYTTVGPEKYYLFNPTAFPVVQVDSSLDPTILRHSISGVSNPLYKRAIRDAVNATSNLDAYHYSVERHDHYYRQSASGSTAAYGDYVGHRVLGSGAGVFPSPDPSLIDSAVAPSVSRLNEYIRGFQNPLYAQQTAGEFKETLHFLVNPLKQSHNLVSSYASTLSSIRKKAKGATRRELSKLLKEHANSWLEFRFGILPLISDISTIVKIAEDKTLVKERGRFVGKSSSGKTLTLQRGYAYAGFSCGIDEFNQTDILSVIRVGFITDKLHRIGSLTEAAVQDFTNLGEVIPTLWEITPYSWLADYFVNVQDLLNSHIDMNSYISYTSHSVITDTLWIQEAKDFSYFLPYTYSYDDNVPCSLIYKKRSVTRRALSSLIPPVVFHLPGSEIKYANIAALLTQKLL